ncbi:hypothetical protein CupriaWKF_05620 [Cupriavidus sp. WKF15]|uniref:hypothetical protein n=1 Tax=Cupriavidus sp. WKF15 TaxID=3032282 RepID=UPI0023E24D09|nr:hypothetical protein [Cupriavidus sp. WKF15]WER47046.1 hypothetical protein CupriaWKF_05620 [Cupriavidus sp. WKF15]
MDGFGMTTAISDFSVLAATLQNLADDPGSIERKSLLAEITRFIDLLERSFPDEPVCRSWTSEARILIAQDLPVCALDRIDALLVRCGAKQTLPRPFTGFARERAVADPHLPFGLKHALRQLPK